MSGSVSQKDSELRRRYTRTISSHGNREKDNCSLESTTKKKPESENVVLNIGTLWLTRIVILRSIGAIYAVAFLVAITQNKQLIGRNGLLPANLYLDRIKKHSDSSNWRLFEMAPTLFWLFDYHKHCDVLLNSIAGLGLVISLFVVISGCANMVLMFILWMLYHSLVNVGQRWYSFGWESQLLETGFLAIFLCPVLSLKAIPEKTPPSMVVVMCYRWLIFRIMIGAGLIKLRGDKCWRDLTCMNYHYQTQPVPNPTAYFMHQEPEVMHKMETMANHLVELVVPWLLLLPRKLAMVGGIMQIFFQVVLIISGNLSFLNWLTIVPSLACLDDRFYATFFGRSTKARVAELQEAAVVNSRSARRLWGSDGRVSLRRVLDAMLLGLIAWLSIPVMQNLVSSRQIMNTSFDSLRIVNTYGAFGSITKERTEVILQGTRALHPDDPKAEWFEYEFKCKPGAVSRRPCLISPFHYRLDWLMWFAAFQSYEQNEWLVHLAAKLLVNNEDATSLIDSNPFVNGTPPLWIRAEHYRYRFAPMGSAEARRGDWWIRERVQSYLPPVSLETLESYLKHFGWPPPRKS